MGEEVMLRWSTPLPASLYESLRRKILFDPAWKLWHQFQGQDSFRFHNTEQTGRYSKTASIEMPDFTVKLEPQSLYIVMYMCTYNQTQYLFASLCLMLKREHIGFSFEEL